MRLSGENFNELYVASKIRSNLEQGKKSRFEKSLFAEDKEIKSRPWFHHAIPSQAFACPIQKIMSTIDPPSHEKLLQMNKAGHESYEDHEASTIIGAKMIRIQNGQWTVKEAVDYFNTAFPCAKYIVNIRSDIDGQAESMANLGWDVNKEKMEGANDFLERFAKQMGQNKARLIDMNDWVAEPFENDESEKGVRVLNHAVRWLGFKDCRFQSLLHENDNSHFTADTTAVNLGDNCYYPGISPDE